MTTAELNKMSAMRAAPAEATENSILQSWTGPYDGVPPWDEVKVADFPQAFQVTMDKIQAEVNAIRDNPAPATFENFTVPMELVGNEANNLFSIWGVHSSNLSNEEVREIQGEWLPKVSAFFDQLTLDPKLLAKTKAVYDNRETAGLDAKQMRLVERNYEQLVRDGALLGDADKAQLIAYNTELSKAFNDFSNKVLADEETFIFLTDEADLAGLPDSFVASLAEAAEEQGKTGWALKNTRSVMQPFLENSTRRDLREQVYTAYVNRGDNGGENDTNATIAKILKLRADRAKLLGFETHAHYRMADTMAKEPDAAMDLMMQVWPAAVARVKEEVADMQAIADAEGAGITIAPWDYRYYAEKVRKEKYDLDSAEIKPYFQLDKMMDALFDAAGKLYGLTFTETTGSIPVFDPEVRTFEVKRGDKVIGVQYFDNYARQGKRSGAWMTTYKDKYKLGGQNNYSATSNNNNFVKGGDGEPTLISLDDAQTLFHEFGHALHYLNYDITYPGLGGTPRDFVEYPSQVNENWLMTPYILSNYALHYKTGEPIPKELVDKIQASKTFNEGFSTVEYLSSAIVDMKLHNRETPVTDPDKFERETLTEIGMPKEIVMRHRLPQFNHLFSSDAYSAGYYSYLWSETMDADTWAAFEEAGSPWDKTTAERFRTILLSTGNETDRKEAYRKFRGRDPEVKYILKKRGFPVPGESADAAKGGKDGATK
ncbi:MAG: M3 family metallopeptidase [Sphingomonadales bacterium]|nr:M3 family metallopeptidase [Sphingomonadales bacterium]PIX64123.1 MAG: M3 family peptidase [Sphingomonadales bacterium CG_4_10_14_3_um_filter_58_15]NCO49091.1 M3 family metallopeptidase [Sphingomonadales bacterium]NCO99446.1 M3 family metallopeptidase [Sphingomonadales bacterium]NCP27098.1 M3 family metallopeptidase [Sphingomonadales bacterium]